jgi:hypothetical protein
MKIVNPLIDKLAGTHNKILVFDCEFWHVFGSHGYTPIEKAPNEFFMPREIGGFLLTKATDGSWTYKKDFFVTLHPPKKKDVSFVSSQFATVTQKTAKELDIYQTLLTTDWHSSYLQTLPDTLHDILLAGIATYLDDENIRRFHKPTSWYKTFLEHFSDSLVVVKGTSDLDALQNACKIHGLKYIPPKNIYDVAFWNPQSYRNCGTAKLEGTYNCILPKLDTETQSLIKVLPVGKAHNPMADAAMTFIVALYIKSMQ